MTDLIRLSLSIEKTLYERLENLVQSAGYSNRSEYVRDMIRDKLVATKWNSNSNVIASITLVFDHSMRGLSKKLAKVQHSHFKEILASTHVHLSQDMCAEMILVKATVSKVKHIADTLRQQKGVLHAEVSMSALGDELN